MNRQLNRLAVVAVVLLTALIVATTYWQAWAAGDLKAKQDNAIQRVVQFTIARGLIYGADGKTVFAANKKKKTGTNTLFFRRYPNKGLAAQTIGYSTVSRSQTGLEESMNDFLTGSNTNLSNAFHNLLNKLGRATIKGDNLQLTIRPKVQRLAQQLLGNRCGAVVAMSPRTGAVYVMASSPTYDPNEVDQPGGYARILHIRGACDGASALYDRATQGLFTPGSTFKIVTAAAALDTGAFTPNSGFTDPGYCTEYGQKVFNSGNPDQGGHEVFGHLNLLSGFQHSVNSVFCNIGMKLGAKTLVDYAKRFGFYSPPPLETPPDTINASGLYKNGKLWSPTSNSQIDSGRLAFGQYNMLATPLQMALVGATIANKGVVPKPYLLQKVVAADGSTVTKTTPQTLGEAIKPQTAAELNQMMQLVVQGGTAASVGFPAGLKVAGKTGTAELGLGTVYDAWFVCFAPADHPRYVVAAVVQKQPNGFGASVAAPIAKAILEKLLHR